MKEKQKKLMFNEFPYTDIDMVKLYFTSSFYTKITQDLFFLSFPLPQYAVSLKCWLYEWDSDWSLTRAEKQRNDPGV